MLFFSPPDNGRKHICKVPRCKDLGASGHDWKRRGKRGGKIKGKDKDLLAYDFRVSNHAEMSFRSRHGHCSDRQMMLAGTLCLYL